MTDTTYNGWSNYETWCVNLWLENDPVTSEHWYERADEAWLQANDEPDLTSRSQQARITLAEWLKDQMFEEQPDLGASMFSDLMAAALDEVDWFEIADSWLENSEQLPGYQRRDKTAATA